MKQFLLTLFCVLAPVLLYAQSEINYSYDSAGNRVERNVIMLKSIAKSASAGENVSNERVDTNAFEDEFNERKISIYPNPTSGNLAINISGANLSSSCIAQVYNIIGKKLMELPVQMNNVTKLNMNNLPASTYLLILIFDSEKLTYKIIKQ